MKVRTTIPFSLTTGDDTGVSCPEKCLSATMARAPLRGFHATRQEHLLPLRREPGRFSHCAGRLLSCRRAGLIVGCIRPSMQRGD